MFVPNAPAGQKYVDARPDQAHGHYLLGETYRREAPDGPDFAPRVTAYQRAIEVQADFAQAHLELGMVRTSARAKRRRSASFERYLALKPAVDPGIASWHLANL